MYNDLKDFDNTFNIQSKGRRHFPDPAKEELICYNCINKELIEAKKQREQQLKNAEIQNDVQDRLNKLTKDKIQSKIKSRIRRSEEAAKNLQSIPQEKEKLIRENEKGTFFLNDASKIGNDPVKEKIMKNFRNGNKQLRNLNRSFDNSSKRKIDNYYKNYVDNYIEPEKIESNRKFLQQKYIDELEHQIEDNQKLKAKRKQLESQVGNKDKAEEDEKYFKNLENERLKRQRLNENFLKENQKLINLRSRQKQQDKRREQLQDEQNWKNIENQLKRDNLQKMENDNKKKRDLRNGLNQQINEKIRKKALDKAKDTGFVPFVQCTCEGKGTCVSCNKTYPLKFLNPVTKVKAPQVPSQNLQTSQKLENPNIRKFRRRWNKY